MGNDDTTIQVPKTLRDDLKKLKSYPEEPLWRIIKRLMEAEK